MKITYDTVADAVYLKMSDKPVAQTVRAQENIIIDRDAEGHVIGLELLNASREGSLLHQLKEHVPTGFPVEITSATPVLA